MRNLIFSLVLLLLQPAFAENTEILKCKVDNDEWHATVVIDSLGSGILKFQKKSGDPKLYVCAMRMTSFSDMRTGVIPMILATLNVSACDPAITQYRDKILSTVYLQVQVKTSPVEEGNLQWLQDRAPEDCKMEKLKLEDMHEYSVKWSQGKWGRRPASSPEKIPKKF